MPETWNLVRKYTHYVVSENIPFSTMAFLILQMSGLFCKKLAFIGKNSTFTQSISVWAMLEIFCSAFSFCKIKDYFWKVLETMHQIAPNWPNISKMKMTSQNLLTWRHQQFLLMVSLVKFNYWFKFHVNIITGSGPEIRK